VRSLRDVDLPDSKNVLGSNRPDIVSVQGDQCLCVTRTGDEFDFVTIGLVQLDNGTDIPAL
jgi:hypothetical protein